MNVDFSTIAFEKPSTRDSRLDDISSQNTNRSECFSLIITIVRDILF